MVNMMAQSLTLEDTSGGDKAYTLIGIHVAMDELRRQSQTLEDNGYNTNKNPIL